MKAHARKAYVKSDGTQVSAASVKSFCRVQSLIEKKWTSRLVDGPPNKWPNKDEIRANWTADERNRFFEAMEELPELFDKIDISSVHRLKESKEAGNPASHSNPHIVLYDAAFSGTNMLSRTIAHEFSHQYYDGLSKAMALDYRRDAGWKYEYILTDRKFYWVPRQDGFVQADGANSTAEDFANNVEFYLFSPEVLRKTSPQIFQWMKKHFGDNFKLRAKK